MAKKRLDIADVWDVSDPRDVPAYTIPEAAHYLSMPAATLRNWVLGKNYERNGKKAHFKSVIDLPNSRYQLLSFFNLAEAHALRWLRTRHEIRLETIRPALDYVKAEFGWNRPLIQQEFQTDGVKLFVQKLGKTVEASAHGQIVMSDVMAHLKRIEFEDKLAARLYPFTRADELEDDPKSVFIDPRFSFGRPILKASGIATAVIAERYKAGDSVQDLAADYGCSQLEIEEGIRCELRLAVAA